MKLDERATFEGRDEAVPEAANCPFTKIWAVRSELMTAARCVHAFKGMALVVSRKMELAVPVKIVNLGLPEVPELASNTRLSLPAPFPRSMSLANEACDRGNTHPSSVTVPPMAGSAGMAYQPDPAKPAVMALLADAMAGEGVGEKGPGTLNDTLPEVESVRLFPLTSASTEAPVEPKG